MVFKFTTYLSFCQPLFQICYSGNKSNFKIMRIFITILISIGCIMLIGCVLNEPSKQDLTFKTMPENLLQLQVIGYENGDRIPARFATIDGGGRNFNLFFNKSL